MLFVCFLNETPKQNEVELDAKLSLHRNLAALADILSASLGLSVPLSVYACVYVCKSVHMC